MTPSQSGSSSASALVGWSRSLDLGCLRLRLCLCLHLCLFADSARSANCDLPPQPQHDILYDELTSIEHLDLYGALKGKSHAEVKAQIGGLLEGVKLTNVASKVAGSYSGGMKRRLSVAISLVGSPKVVMLDEPTTGMDPMNRKHVWCASLRRRRRSFYYCCSLLPHAPIR